MKILLVNTFDRGGAANACLRLNKGLLQAGMDSKVLLRDKEKKLPYTFKLKPIRKKISTSQKIVRKLENALKSYGILKKRPISKKVTFLKNRNNQLEYFSFPDAKFDITASKLYKEADIINLHWVAGFLDYKSFFEKNTKPVVWTLHDMNAFTGGEHYEEKYLGIDELGKPSKRVVTVEEENIFSENITIKKQALEGVANLNIVSPSNWLAKEAKKSELFKSMPIYCIPNGVDSNSFKPRDKEHSKNLFNIPNHKKVVLFVADSISNNRKGFIFLKKAFEQIDTKNVVLCAIGNKSEMLKSIDNILELGPIYDERLMSAAYSAADVFVIPSLMDNLPNTVLESLMCGTPVIGFPVGGIPDMVQHEKNGMLTDEVSVPALLSTLNNFLSGVYTFDRKSIRASAIEKYDISVQAEAYKALYKEILKK